MNLASTTTAPRQKFFSISPLSANQWETPEKFLICENVPITKLGTLEYWPGEVPKELNADGMVTVNREEEDIFNTNTIASFNSKPITIDHPDDFVNPDNYQRLSVGTVENVRRGEGIFVDKLVADLVIKDAKAIYAVKNNLLREVSCGYEANFVSTGKNQARQMNIIGNHLALVDAGRAGAECRIFDSASPKNLKTKKGLEIMTENKLSFTDKMKKAFGRFIDEAKIEDAADDSSTDTSSSNDALMKMLTAMQSQMNDLSSKIDAAGKDAATAAENIASDEENQNDVINGEADMPSDFDSNTNLITRVGNLETLMAKIAEQLGVNSDMDSEKEVTDKAINAKAEILSPGIAKVGDVKTNALKAAYQTNDGKTIIAPLLNGKTIDSLTVKEKDILFHAASELIKNNRKPVYVGDSENKSFNANPHIKPMNEMTMDDYKNLYNNKSGEK